MRVSPGGGSREARTPFLWRFHSIHRSAEHLDWLAAHREHPVDSIYTIGLINLPAFVLGYPLSGILGFIQTSRRTSVSASRGVGRTKR